jgi:methionyl-tRNA synthetase
MKEASVKGFWANNAIQMTQAWIRDGLKPRAITRDLKWGIPVPKAGFEDKVFYVWFDAPIGYISIAATLGDEKGFDYENWWKSPGDVELYQFIGKDNIPFHTVIFPSTLLGSGRNWTMLHHMSSTEYLNYESGKFSKSRGIGVFGTDVMETGIPADVWRFYIFYNRPEKSDVTFTWNDFMERVNGELIGNLGNLANRTLAFIQRFYDGVIPAGKPDEPFWIEVRKLEEQVAAQLERADLRDAFRTAFQIADMANKRFQAEEPWKARTANPEKAASLLSDLCYVLRDLSIIMHPYMPVAMNQLAGFFGLSVASEPGASGMTWKNVGKLEGLQRVDSVGVLFQKLEADKVAELRERYSGSQKERAERDAKNASSAQTAQTISPGIVETPAPKPLPYAGLPVEERFARLIDLRVAKIIKVERHPKADKLYIETLDDGSGQARVIVSGLVPFYREEELLGKSIVLVNNLKPAKLRGVESRGMLLAASRMGNEGKEAVEVLDAPWAVPGTRVMLEGQDADIAADAEIDAEAFFSVPVLARSGKITIGSKTLVADGAPFSLVKVSDGEVG